MRFLMIAPLVALELGCGSGDATGSATGNASVSAVVVSDRPQICTRGPIRFEPASHDAQLRLISPFSSSNRASFQGTHLDDLGHYVTTSGPILGPTPGAPEASPAELERKAREFVRKNADLFGLERVEVEDLHVRDFETGGGMAKMSLWSNRVVPGYESVALEREVNVVVDLYRTGEVAFVVNRSALLPPTPLCTASVLAATDPAVRRQVIGKSARFGAIDGTPASMGPVEEKDIGKPKLVVYVKHALPDERVVALAYSMALFDGSFTAFVDANTGELMEMHQNFST